MAFHIFTKFSQKNTFGIRRSGKVNISLLSFSEVESSHIIGANIKIKIIKVNK
jgi:hypothetical protein